MSVLGLEVGVEVGRLVRLGFWRWLGLGLRCFISLGLGHLANPIAFIIIFMGPGMSSLLSIIWNCPSCSQSDCW